MIQPSSSRTVRIFISSTFRDFTQERDLLVRKVFPDLRRRCRKRHVELIDVDLRWGITEAQAEQGKVLPICLAEIDRARPFFIGLLGERYGWVPAAGQFDRSLLIEQPWLEEQAGGKSVTELEILHGVLNNPEMAGRAFFYFRDPAWSQKQVDGYASEGVSEKQKLLHLKDRIRSSGFPVVENYPDPETLAERVREDLWRLIDEAYPESEAPDPLSLERRRHDAYGGSRRRLYLGGERYFEAVDTELAAESPRPVLVTGQSGGGKSALLSNWLARWQPAHPEAAVIMHHLGCGVDAADSVRLAVRIMQEIAAVTGEEFKQKSNPDEQLDELLTWLAIASAWAGRTARRLLLVLDGLDKLTNSQRLRWFPMVLPPGVSLVASCLDGEVLEAARPRLDWRELVVEPLTKAEQSAFIRDYLGRFRKQLTADQTRLLQGHPLVGNPLFLLTVLEELRVFGVHEELDRRLATLLSLPPSKQPGEEPTVDDVFEHVLARIEADHGREVVQRVMEAIWASRAGLFTDELLEIAQVPPATWAGIENSLDESLYENGGRTTFGHDYLRKAVEDRYDITGERKRDVHRRLGKYFTTLHVDTRVAEELPWQWEQAGEKERLEACLTESKLFVALKERDEYDLLSYWLRLGGDIGDAYEAAWQRWGLKVGVESPARSLVQFLNTAGCYTAFALGMSRDVMWLMNEKLGRDHPDTLSALAGFATCLWNTGDLRLMAEAVDVRETLLHLTQMRLGANHPDTLMAMTDLAVSCLRRGYPQKAWPMAREVRRLSREQLGTDHPVTIRVMNALADCELDYPSGWERSFLPDDSDRLLEDESYGLRMREEILRLTQTRMGTHHPKTLMAMGNLADSHHALGHLEEAVGMKEKTLHLIRQLLGSHHPDTLKAMSSLARSLSAADRPKEAVGIREELLCRLRQRLGADHHDTQIELSELTSCYEKIGLTNLSDAAAQEFGQHSGSLHLDFITNLSDAAAQALGGHKGGLLYLNGLTSLSDAAAESLARHEGVLSLDGLTNLSDVSAQALAKHKEHGLRLNGLASLSDAAAQALAQHRTSRSGILEINSVTSLSEAAAESFAQHKGLLNLNGLTSLSEAAARSLAKHDEWLQLNGLTSLSDAAARSLANHKEWLFLNGLASLSDAAAQALAEHKGDLSLDGLTSLGDTLGHVALARTLAKQNSLHLNNLTSLSDAAAESLARHEGVLSLNGLTNLSDVAAQALGGHKGQLRLNGITSLSDAAARALAQAGCGPSSCLSSERLGWPCFKVISENDNRYTWKKPVSNRRVRPGHLELNGLTSLSNAAAEALAQHEDVSLSDVAQLAVGMFGIATKFAQGLQATRLANEEEESDNDRPRAKIKKLLREKTLEGVTLGIALLESTAATPADWEAIFTPQICTSLLNSWVPEIWELVAKSLESYPELSTSFQTLALERYRKRPRKHADFDGLVLARKAVFRPAFVKRSSAAENPGAFMEFISIPAGSFTIGSPKKEKGRSDDEKQVPVTIARAFDLGKTVVTQKQWTEVMGTTPWKTTFTDPKDEDIPPQSDNYPAVYVSWDEATEFCEKLTVLERKCEKLPANQTYRLPTEAEWEYACRAGTMTAFSFGDDESSLGDYAWYDDNSGLELHEVATKKPNPWGLFDMHGNVWEWCEDWHEVSLSGGNEPKGPSAGSARVLRGGSWLNNASICHSANRNKHRPSGRHRLCGFRVVRVALMVKKQ